MKTTILCADDIRAIVHHVGLDRLMDETIEALCVTCRDYDPARYSVPVRDGFDYALPDPGLLEWMPVLAAGDRATVKIVGYHPANPARRKLPTILSVALAFDPRSGHLLALADATFMTALRTGAASAVASRILAPREARVLGLIGCGAQALTQLHALSRVFDLRRVLVYDVDPQASGSFARRTACLGLEAVEIRAARSHDEVAAEADILCTATSIGVGQGPLFDVVALKDGVHVNAVGSDFPGKTELPPGLLRRSFVCPDFLPQAVREGECQQLSSDEIGPDLVELVKNQGTYCARQREWTVFDSTGWAVEDHVASAILMARARELGCGTEVQLESVATDPRNPYAFAGDAQHPGEGTVTRTAAGLSAID